MKDRMVFVGANHQTLENEAFAWAQFEAMSDVLRLDTEIETIRELASMNNVA